MKSFIIAWKDFTIRFRDRRGFFMMMLMPLLLTAILGAALAKTLGNDEMPKTTIAYYQEGEDILAQEFRDHVLQGQALRKDIEIKHVTSKEAVRQMVKDGKADVGLLFPAGFSARLQEGVLQAPIVIKDPGKVMQASIVESALSSFTTRVQTIAVATHTVMADLAVPVMTGQLPATDFSKQLQVVNGTVQEKAVGKRMVSSMAYYAVGMGVMFLLFNVAIGAKLIIAEKTTETLARLLRTPTSPLQIIIGKFLGTLLFTFVQFGLFVAATHYIFGVNWGDVSMTMAVGGAYAICIAGLSMALAVIIRSEKTADVVSHVVIQLFALLGGSMLPIYAFSDGLKQIANIAPNKWALLSFLDIMGGATWSQLTTSLIVLLSIGVTTLLFGTWRLRLR